MIVLSLGASAQDAPIYKRGYTVTENTMPPSPEPASVVKYADVPVTLSQGLVHYEIPFYTLQGRELSVPISLSYTSGGIKLNEIAGVAGLGWTLNAGGCITRTVVNMPDEFTAAQFEHEMPSGTLLSSLENQSNTTEAMNYLRDILWRRVDSSLDRFSYNICGLQGSFVIQDDGEVYQFSGDGVLISYTRAASGSIDSFSVVGPDGTIYTLSEKEVATHEGSSDEIFTPTSGEPDRWTATTAWYLTQITSRSGLETAQLTYSSPREWDRTIFTTTRSLQVNKSGATSSTTTDLNSRYIVNSYQTKVLSSISLAGYSATFSYASDTGSHYHTGGQGNSKNNFPFRLTEISIAAPGGGSNALATLELDTRKENYDGRIILSGLELYRSGTLDDRWSFSYKTLSSSVSHYSQDWYGYYNAEKESGSSGKSTLCPFVFQPPYFYTQLTYGTPDATKADYLSLTGINHDGASTGFIYEGNSYSQGQFSSSIGVRIKTISVLENMSLRQERQFSYTEPSASGPVFPQDNMYITLSVNQSLSGGSDPTNPFFDVSYLFNFSLHETPVVLGPSLQDTYIRYGKVTEDVSQDRMLNSGPTARTVYHFTPTETYPIATSTISRFPSTWESTYNSVSSPVEAWIGVRPEYLNSGPGGQNLLTRTEVYEYKDNAYVLRSATDYTYNTSSRSDVLVDYYATQVMQRYLYGQLEYSDIYHFPVYACNYYEKRPTKTVSVEYLPGGNSTTTVNTVYKLRAELSTPIRVSSVSNETADVTRSVSFSYADDFAASADWHTTLKNQHYLSEAISQSYSIGDGSSSGGGIIIDPDIPIITPTEPSLDPITPITPIKPGGAKWKEEIKEFGWFTVDGTQRLLPSVHKENTLGGESWRETILTRDCMGNVSSFKEKGKPETVVIWSYGGTEPVAIIENATYVQVSSALGGQYALDAITRAQTPSASQLSALNGLRSTLTGAHVRTYTHLLGIGPASVTSPAGLSTGYEYDPGARLAVVRDHDGNKTEEHIYSLLNNGSDRRSIRHRSYRNDAATQYTEDVEWWSLLGLKTEDIAIDAAGDGRDLVTAYGSDFLLHDDEKVWVPYPVETGGGAARPSPATEAANYHGSDLAYYYKQYEISSRDRVIASAQPGFAGTHSETYSQDVAGAFPILLWKDGAISNEGDYSSGEVLKETVTDADGKISSVFSDWSGRVLGTSLGSDIPTYYIYDVYDRLRAVVGSGIALTDTLSMWRYGYDTLGRLNSKGIPGSIREHYSYDSEDRIISVTKGSRVEELEYDAFGRVLRRYRTVSGGARTLVEEYSYDFYPSGVSGGPAKGLETQRSLAEIAPGGGVSGYTQTRTIYDAKQRPSQVQTQYADGGSLVESYSYNFADEVIASTLSSTQAGVTSVLSSTYTYDIRGRMTAGTEALTVGGVSKGSISTQYGYDALGRPQSKAATAGGGTALASSSGYTLQGWTNSHSVTKGGAALFSQTLHYDNNPSLSGVSPLYSGLISGRTESWSFGASVTEGFAYDYAARLSKEIKGGVTSNYAYDARGNLSSESGAEGSRTYSYVGDRLASLVRSAGGTSTFTHDEHGRMTYDGLSGLNISYNHEDLPSSISDASGVKVSYSYLSDGTKLSALKPNGEGLVYRGPFVYRRSSGGSLSFESVSAEEGRLSSAGEMLYVEDYLGSVRAVVSGAGGALLEASNYSAFGTRVQAPSAPIGTTPAGITLRDHYTAQEDQAPDFAVPYTDFGARQYNVGLRRWMTPDPLSEKYYGISPYAFCNNSPMVFVDRDGRDIYRYDDKTGIFYLEIKNNDSFDQVARFRYNRKEDSYEIAKFLPIRISNIAKGILSDGLNFNDNANAWSTDIVSIEDFQNFIIEYTEMAYKEMGGFYYSDIDSSDIKYIHIGKGEFNTHTKSYPTPGIEKVDPNLLGKVKAQVNWHTHPSNETNSTTPSRADKEFKERQSKNGVKHFIILTKGYEPINF